MTEPADARPDTPGLLDDPHLLATTFIVIEFEATTPRGHPPEPIEVAAVGLRREATAWRRTAAFSALIRPPAHAPLTPGRAHRPPRSAKARNPAPTR